MAGLMLWNHLDALKVIKKEDSNLEPMVKKLMTEMEIIILIYIV